MVAGAGGPGGNLGAAGTAGGSNTDYPLGSANGGKAGGSAGPNGSTGPQGNSVSGNSNITYIATGTRNGPIG
jgi:hypothetical protein